MDNNFQTRNAKNETQSKAKIFWKNVGYVAIGLGLAVLTVFILNFNR